MTYATGDTPPDAGHYVCIHCDTKIDIAAHQVLPACKCPEGKGAWVEHAKEYEDEQ